MFNFLQRIGKALMTPIAVLPIAALLLRLGFGDVFDGDVAKIAKLAGESIFSNLDLLFGIGIAYGFAKNNDGTAALSGAVGVLVAKAVYLGIDENLKMGVFIGIIMGVIAGTLYNKFHEIKLPEFLGFFGGKRFVPIITTLSAIVVGVFAGYFWHFVGNAIDGFSHFIIDLGAFGTFLFGVLNRLLIPLGLHHILNSVFWFQLGEYSYVKDGVVTVANGDLHRFFAGDKSAGFYMSGFYAVMMFGLPSMALAMYMRTPKESRKKVGVLLGGVAFTAFLTGITEPLEFMFIFVAPVLFVVHALLTGLALASAQLLDIHMGFGFSAGLIDYLINYKLGQNSILIIPLGLVFGLLYFFVTYFILGIFKINLFKEEEEQAIVGANSCSLTDEFIKALGGAENIVETSACITRLRMHLKDSSLVDDDMLKNLGASGVIRPDKNSLQVVLGTKAESIAGDIKSIVGV
ncbi:PTS system transporter subunit IIBC [Sulfurovum sp. enrichment culture clone C5]|uniref:PTS system transporter subunit IIBC n=1 Tax=Sulfurovum sp. enrichment culture clone C5 TaxID=497650 RepID=A0A0S4XNB7_9BACT|nr:PTS system transporter subunit IIBC [Sulfurovum sp. enrichment culture clone C5]